MPIKKIILVHHTHTDIGYTGLWTHVAARHIRHFRSVLDHCRQDPRFRWTIETGWTLETFLTEATAEEKKDLQRFFHAGQLKLTGFYTQPLTQLCNLEQFTASVEFNLPIADQFGLRPNVVMINDIGGMSYNAPQILNYFGIRYLVNGCGGWRVMLPFAELPHLFYLAGPDGSKLLYYHIGDDAEHRGAGLGAAQYGFGLIYFLWPMLREIDGRPALVGDDGEKTILNANGREGIDLLCRRLDREKYPYDILLMQIGSDNQGPIDRLTETVDEWNRRYRDIEFRLGTCAEFFAEVEHRYGPAIPVIQGELTCSWSEHAVTNAGAIARFRQAGRELNDWAALDACRIGQRDVRPDAWGDIMKNLVLYAEHTCGLSMWDWEKRLAAAGSFWSDQFDMPRYSWETKARFTDLGQHQVRAERDRQAVELTAEDPDNPQTVSVFNPLSFSASGLLRFTTPQPNIELIRSDGAVIPVDSRTINPKWYLHQAWLDTVPPFGLRVLKIRPTDQQSPPNFTCEKWTLQGPNAVVRLDPQTGAVQSLTTSNRSDDWVDTGFGHLNELFYFNVDGVADGPYRGGLDENVTFNRLPLCETRQVGLTQGCHAASLLVERTLIQDNRPVLAETQYLLDFSGLTIRNRVRKIHTCRKEACFFAFPFQMKAPWTFDVEQQGQITHFPDERLPGSSNHDLGMQDFICVSDDRSQAVLTSLQAALVCLGQPRYYHFGRNFAPIDRPAVFSYAFNNLWNTNCPVHQQGDLVFEYHLACLEHPFSPVAAYQTSRRAAHPLTAFVGDLRKKGFHAEETNLLSLTADNVLVDSVRPLENKTRQIRLVEIGRKNTNCDLVPAPGRFTHYALKVTHHDAPDWKTLPKNIPLTFRPAEFKTLWLK